MRTKEMRFTTRDAERAREIYLFLRLEFPYMTQDRVTYGDIAKVVGGIAQGVSRPLHFIQAQCAELGLPTFTVFVVRASDGLPGGGCDVVTPEAVARTLADVRSREWPTEAWW